MSLLPLSPSVADSRSGGACRYLEAALCLAQLHIDAGDAAAANTLLTALEDDVQRGAIALADSRRRQVRLSGPWCPA